MRSFVFDNDETLLVEANFISELVESKYDALRLAQLGKKCRLNGVIFKLIAFNRNAVYRIRAMNGWYLKLPVTESSSMVEHELLGAQAVHRGFLGQSDYLTPTSIHVGSKLGYVLTAELPGTYLNSALYRGCIQPWSRPTSVIPGFRNLGTVLAQLHQNTPTKNIPKSTTPTALEKLQKELSKTHKRDATSNMVEEWLDSQSIIDDTSFVHGNLRRENILFHEGNVGLLDFETCGVGSRYDDLSLVSSDFGLTRAAVFFPWRQVFSACDSLLRGYRESFSLDQQELRKKTLIQLATNYFWILAGKKVSVAKIPISKRRLAKMIQSSICGDWQTAFPGIEF